MKRLRIYVDTSVIGGCFDPEFVTWSKGLIEDFQAGRFRLVLSDITAAGIERAPIQVRELRCRSRCSGQLELPTHYKVG